MTNPDYPNRLRALRVRHDLRLFEVAALVQRDQSAVTRYETGASGIPDSVKLTLAEHYGVSVSHLMGWDDESEDAA